MKTKKILAWLTLWVFALSSFPANIFANNNLTDIEKKICENKDKLLWFEADKNGLYTMHVNEDFGTYVSKNWEKLWDYYKSVSYGWNDFMPMTIKLINWNIYDDTYDPYDSYFIKNWKRIELNIGYFYDEYIKFNIEKKYDWYYRNWKKILDENFSILNVIWEDVYYLDNNLVLKRNNDEINLQEWHKIIKVTDEWKIITYKKENNWYNYYLDYEKKFFTAHDNGELYYFWNDLYDIVKSEDWLYIEIYKNSDLIHKIDLTKIKNIFKKMKDEDEDGYYYKDGDEIRALFSFNQNWDIYEFLEPRDIVHRWPSIILKNWKLLCENLETPTPPNPPKDTKTPTNWSQNSENNTAGSAPSSIKSNEPIQKDKRVSTDTKELENNKKEDKKTENPTKTPEKKVSTNSSLSETEKTIIKKSIDSIFEKYSKNKSFLEKIYKVLTSREDILEMAEKNPRIKFVIEDFKEKFLRFKVKNF